MTAYVDQSASGLRYFLAASSLDVTPFEVIKTASFNWEHRTIEMGILGASHYLQIDWGDNRVLTELFACANPAIDVAFIKSAPFTDLPVQHLVSFADKQYRFTPRLVSWEDGRAELEALERSIAQADNVNRAWGLKHQFPSLPEDDHTKPPLTLAYARVGAELNLKTAHCYPNEEQIVFTTTSLSKKG